MVSMWGSKKSDDRTNSGTASPQNGEAGDNARSASRNSYDRRDPDERSRLLPANPLPPRRDGYLDPDDPAVSPYNLWTVRFLRYLTILFLIITFAWWIIQLVSIFVSPPGMNTRGSGFFSFSYTTLTTGNLFVSLLFFSAPSKAMRISCAVIAVVLLVNMILILAVPKLRHEEGWVGIASVVWAVLIAAWCVLTDRVVEWGKKEEEERLTGREETRRTLKEWLAVLIGTIILIAYIVITILFTSTLILRSIDTGLEMDGERYWVDGDKYQVHLACVGEVTETDGKRDPTLLLEAGEQPSEYDFEHWAYSTYENGTVSRYCYWDRPGYAWSDNAPSPHSAGMSADALSEALARADEEGPWILVSAGTGSVVSRIFAARHPHDVAGMLMVDPMHEDLLHRLSSPRRGFMLWGYGIISPLGIEPLLGALFKGRTRQDRVYGKTAYQSGRFIKAELQESLVAGSLSKNEVVTARAIIDRDMPIAIVSSGIECARDREWQDKQKELTNLTDKLIGWDKVSGAPHRVWMTLKGRNTMEKRLGEIVKAGYW